MSPKFFLSLRERSEVRVVIDPEDTFHTSGADPMTCMPYEFTPADHRSWSTKEHESGKFVNLNPAREGKYR